ncbi:hypothetical protein ABZP36_016551 [Zizania latifolia]
MPASQRAHGRICAQGGVMYGVRPRAKLSSPAKGGRPAGRPRTRTIAPMSLVVIKAPARGEEDEGRGPYAGLALSLFIRSVRLRWLPQRSSIKEHGWKWDEMATCCCCCWLAMDSSGCGGSSAEYSWDLQLQNLDSNLVLDLDHAKETAQIHLIPTRETSLLISCLKK